jgi:hypothetical protein
MGSAKSVNSGGTAGSNTTNTSNPPCKTTPTVPAENIYTTKPQSGGSIWEGLKPLIPTIPAIRPMIVFAQEPGCTTESGNMTKGVVGGNNKMRNISIKDIKNLKDKIEQQNNPEMTKKPTSNEEAERERKRKDWLTRLLNLKKPPNLSQEQQDTRSKWIEDTILPLAMSNDLSGSAEEIAKTYNEKLPYLPIDKK